MHSHTAMHREPALDLTFRAFADQTRRSMIHSLAGGQARRASELGAVRRKPRQEAGNWLRHHQEFWTGAVDQLEQLLKATE